MDLRSWLVVATVIGALIAGYGLLAAYLHGRAAPAREQKRLDDAERLRKIERDKIAALPPEEKYSEEASLAIVARSEARYAEAGILRATNENLPRLGALEARRVALLNYNPRDLGIAAAGLVISTGASIWSLFLTG